ncbi:TolB-like protein [Breznakibacter xylanolyticus]|uniref:TolB-like protein n=1 Tax=Breznakibacter xylanolyticus TaxID=990 RepID=A0A2W7N985_9BACT|nr:BF3164 family lipoprotein [Breznakibacter xylanolyticus]PZX13424.1 TolB-like protein [Breznakibacter xylanolyticus]
MKYLSFALYLLTLTSCIKTQKLEINCKSQKITGFPESKKIHFSSISTYEYSQPQSMYINNDRIILINSNGQSDGTWINVLKKNGDLIKTHIKYGKGPNEILDISSSNIIENNLCLYDFVKKEYWYINISLEDSLISRNYKTKIDGFKAKAFDDEIIIANQCNTSHKLNAYNINQNKYTNGIGNLSDLSTDLPNQVKMELIPSEFGLNHMNNRIAIAYNYFDALEIYSIKGDLIKSTKGPYFQYPEFNFTKLPQGYAVAKDQSSKLAYVSMHNTNKYIYLTYSGNPLFLNNKYGWYGDHIHVYDWDGNPIVDYELNEPIESFCIDEENQLIYSISLKSGNLIVGKINK